MEKDRQMKHLLEFESYDSNINKAKIPVYNEDDHIKNPSGEPEMMVPEEDLIEIVGILLGSQSQGKIEMIVADANIPSQGKNAPDYIKDEISKERDRMAKRKYAIYGSRIEKDDRPEDDYVDAINLYVDSEYVITGTGTNNGEECVLAIPRSFYVKTQRDPSLAQKYTIYLSPKQIEEVSYYPTK